METKTAGGETLYCSSLDANESALLETIYKFSDDVAAAKDYSQFVDGFRSLLDAATGSTHAKKLVANLVPKYAMHFPEQRLEAVDAMGALSNDSDATVRLNSIKGFPQLCKDAANKANPEAVQKVTELLVQALSSKAPEREADLRLCTASFEAIIKMDIKNACDKLLSLMEAPEGEGRDELRETACKLLQEKVSASATELIHPFEDIEDYLKTRIEKVLEVASETEFKVLMSLLGEMRIFKPGHKYGIQGLVDIIAEQSLLQEALEPSAVEELQRVSECIATTLPFLQKGAEDKKLSTNIVLKVMPIFKKLQEPHQLLVIQRLTELCPFISKDSAKDCIAPIFELLLEHLAEAPANEDPSEPNGMTTSEDTAAEKPLPEVSFTLIEALLFLVHAYGLKNPEDVAAVTGIPLSENANADVEKYKFFKERLLYTYEVCDTVAKKLNTVVQKAKAAKGTEDQERRLVLEQGLASIKNICDLCRPLVTAKPTCLRSLPSGTFSWQATTTKAVKRPAPQQSPRKTARSPGAPKPSKKPAPVTYIPPSRRR